MKQLSATDASRNFAEVLDSVEGRRESFVVVRRGRAVATIQPVAHEGGRSLKQVLRSHRPDADWAAELQELRESLEPVSDPWRD